MAYDARSRERAERLPRKADGLPLIAERFVKPIPPFKGHHLLIGIRTGRIRCRSDYRSCSECGEDIAFERKTSCRACCGSRDEAKCSTDQMCGG